MAGRRDTGVGVAVGLAVALLSACTTTRPSAGARDSTPSLSPVARSSDLPAATSSPPSATTTGGSAKSCTVRQVVATWRLRRLAWQTVVVPVQETGVAAVGDEVAAGAGGVILFGSAAPADLGTELRRLTALAPGVEPFVMSDEEGGLVQRLANLVGRIPSARTMGATLTPTQIRHLAHRVGSRMSALGVVTMDLAPVLDLDNGPGPSAENPIGTRSFSIHPRVATAAGMAFAAGLRNAGVVPVVKHFPGLGEATANTDVAPAWTKPWAELQRQGLRPFEAAVRAGLPAVMVSNARVPGLTAIPASLSFRVTRGVLRRQLGFHGLVITDALSGGAIRGAGYDVPSATVRALRVGADMVLFSAEASQVAAVARSTVAAIVEAVRTGELRRARLRTAAVHVLEAKHAQLCG